MSQIQNSRNDKVIESWGFTYKTIAFCWVKTTSENKLAWGMGEWTRSNIELCLIATKGRPKRVNGLADKKGETNG